MRRRTLTFLAALALLAVGCGSGGHDLARRGDAATAAPPPAETPTGGPTGAPPPAPAPAPGPDVVRALVTPTGVVVPVRGGTEGAWRVGTPCGGEALVATGVPLHGATVVLDPGHGGSEPGAVGANGLTEAHLNLAVAERTRAALEAAGANVVLTRTADYRITLAARAEIALALEPALFISIHHNGGGDEHRPTPGTEVFFQVASPESRRLAGLLHEELLALFASYEGIRWESDRDAGAKYRPHSSGGDYYGVLRRTAGVVAVLSEALYISNPPEAELLARPEVQQAEADAITRAVGRFLGTGDPGSGFVEPYPRDEPAGSGGGSRGCVDPALV